MASRCFSQADAEAVGAFAAAAQRELVVDRARPMTEGWEDWRAPTVELDLGVLLNT